MSVGYGKYPISPIDVVKTLLGLPTANRDYNFIINTLRLPRTIVTFLVGVSLAIAKLITQGITQNPLAAPGIIGVNAEANLAAIGIILLAGARGAIAELIGFVGLIMPHIARFLVGVDYRWILPYAAILGATLVLIADICGRLVIQPRELPVGLVMPLIGAPFFIYLIGQKIKK